MLTTIVVVEKDIELLLVVLLHITVPLVGLNCNKGFSELVVPTLGYLVPYRAMRTFKFHPEFQRLPIQTQRYPIIQEFLVMAKLMG